MVISILFVSAVLGILLLLDVDERVLRLLTGCAPLPDDEAAWVLEDLASGEGESRLKKRTPDLWQQDSV